MRYGFVFFFSFIGLLWERFWNRFWPTTTVLLFFTALSLLNVPLIFGTVWHMALLALFVAAITLTLLRTSSPFSFPTRADVERQMERASTLDHRPLQTLNDKPAEGLSDESLNLWQKHLQKTALALHSLKIYVAQPNVASRDRWALRHIAVIFLAVGLAVAQQDAAARLKLAITPDINSLIDKKTITLDLWITPPEYTHEATVFLATAKQGLVAHDDAINVPAGSVLKLRLAGLRFAPRLTYAGQKYAVTEAAAQNYTLEMPLQQSGVLTLGRLFSTLGHWTINVLPDTPPEVSVVKVEATPRAATKITYTAQDDHGITKLTGIVGVDGNAYKFDMPTASSADEATFVEDLTSNPSAGEPATIWLEAQDAAGHDTSGTPVAFTLPERHFNNPLAQRIITERKILLKNKNLLSRSAVADNLAQIGENPALYKGDIIVFMSLSTAVRRLIYDHSDEAAASVANLLWDVALKLEDGGLSLAQRELHDSLQKLSQALNDKSTTKQQLQDILDDVQKKMQQYVQSLATELQQKMMQGQQMPALSPALAQQFMKNMDINKLLDQMRKLSQADSRDDLQKMAENLQNSIDNFDMNKFNQMQEKQMQQLQALQNLDDIIHRQQSLYDKTNKSDDPADMKDQKQEQSAIRKQLGDALHKLGDTGADIPENFAKADQAMKNSADALGKGLQQESLPQQKTALDEMQKGVDSAAKKMAESMQMSLLSFGAPGEGNFGEGYDPLGRPNGAMDDHSVKLPSEREQRRVQEIIEELRHRSNEPNRTKVERDYIDRLLDRF